MTIETFENGVMIRTTITGVVDHGNELTVQTGAYPMRWPAPEVVEVRTPDGVTVWKRAVADGGVR